MDASIRELLTIFNMGPAAVAMITLAVAVAPKLLTAATDWQENRKSRWYAKDYLQILKLHCEIQALINTNNLDRESFRLPILPGFASPQPLVVLSRKERFLNTGLGILSPIVLFLVYAAFFGTSSGYDMLLLGLTFGSGLLAVSLVVASVTLVTPLRRGWHAYVIGVSIPIVLVSIFDYVITKGLSGSGAWGG